jgi:hypothetical protein
MVFGSQLGARLKPNYHQLPNSGPVHSAYNPSFSAYFFSAGTIFFSHNKSANSVFQPAYQHSRTAPQIVFGVGQWQPGQQQGRRMQSNNHRFFLICNSVPMQ